MTVYSICCHITTFPQCQHVTFDSEEEFWEDFRASQRRYDEMGQPGVLMALVPKEETQVGHPGGVPDKL